MIPDMSSPSGPIETIAPDLWSDALNIKVLGTIATTQAFLRTICDFRARLLVLTPSIIPSLSPPFHAVESSIVAALDAFTTSLRGELGTVGIDVCQLKLGSFDYGGRSSSVGQGHSPVRTQQSSAGAARADVLSWPSAARALYAKNYFAQSSTAIALSSTASSAQPQPYSNSKNTIQGSPMRDLHTAVFDALTSPSRPQRIRHVGSGSLLYDVVGRWAPAAVVAWMMGIRRVAPLANDEAGPGDWVPDGGFELQQQVDWERVERWA